jgi:hypothetical protein
MEEVPYQAELIVRGRRAAASFCRKQAALFPDAKEALIGSAETYAAEADTAATVFADLLKDDNESRDSWLSEKSSCMAAAASVREMLKLEEAAVEGIEGALERIV